MYTNYSADYVKEHDLLRDWYFFSPEDQAEIIEATRTGSAWTSKPISLNNIKDPYHTKLENIRRGLDISEAYRSKGLSTDLERPTTRGLHEVYYKAKGHDDSSPHYGDQLGVSEAWKQKAGQQFKNAYNPENEYLLNTIWYDSLKNLLRTQKLAAEEANYKILYEKEYKAKVGSDKYSDGMVDEKLGQSTWSAAYEDKYYSVPAANADALQIQINEIDKLDRTKSQKDYLVQKVINRYWMKQIDLAHGTEDLMDFITDKPKKKLEGYYEYDPDDLDVDIKDESVYKLLHIATSDPNLTSVPWAMKNESLVPFSIPEKYTELSQAYDNDNKEFKDNWHELVKPKADIDLIEATERHQDVEDVDVDKHQQVFVDNLWKTVAKADNFRGGVTVLTFSDGTTKEYDEGKAAIQLRVREMYPLVDQKKGDDEQKARLQTLLDDYPVLYEKVANHVDLIAHLMNDNKPFSHSFNVLSWFSDYYNGRKTIEEFPEDPAGIQVLHDENNQPQYVHYQGHVYHIDEIAGASDAYQNNVVNYLKEEHNIDIKFEDINPDSVPFLAYNTDNVPQLYGDESLRKDMNLPDNIAVAQQGEEMHAVWRPEGSSMTAIVPK